MNAPRGKKIMYRAHGAWGKDGRVGLRAEGEIFGSTGMLESPLVVSPDLGGPPIDSTEGPGGTNPEELLVASAATCLMITLGMGLEKYRVPTARLTVEAEGDVEPDPAGGFRFTEIRVTPRVILAGDVDTERLARALQMAEARCIISKVLRGSMRYVVRLVVERSGTDHATDTRELTIIAQEG